MLILQILGRS